MGIGLFTGIFVVTYFFLKSTAYLYARQTELIPPEFQQHRDTLLAKLSHVSLSKPYVFNNAGAFVEIAPRLSSQIIRLVQSTNSK